MGPEGIIALAVAGVLILLVVGFILAYNRLQRLAVKVEEAGSGIDVALEKRCDLLGELLAAVKKYLSHEYETLTGVTALRSGTAGEQRRLDQQEAASTEAMRSIDQEIDRQSRNVDQIRRKLEHGRFRQGKGPRGRERAQEFRAQADAKIQQARQARSSAVNQKISTLASAHRDLNGVTSGIDALYEQYPLLNSWISLDQYQRAAVNVEEHLQAARRLYNANVSLYNQTVRTFPWMIVAGLSHMEPAEFYEADESKRTFEANFD